MFRRAPFFLLWQDKEIEADRIDLGVTMKPTDEEQAQMKAALDIIKDEYRAETDPGRCDRLDLAIQYIENRIAGRLSTLAQLRALLALMDEEEGDDDNRINSLHLTFKPPKRLTLRRHYKLLLLWYDLNRMNFTQKERRQVKRLMEAEFVFK